MTGTKRKTGTKPPSEVRHPGSSPGRALGYARVSTYGQTLHGQLDQLRRAGCRKIYREKVTGATADRRELLKLLEAVAPGDVVTVTRIDRLAATNSRNCYRRLEHSWHANTIWPTGHFALSYQWLRRRPRYRPPVVTVVGAVTLGTASVRARGEIWHNADPNAASALEARLEAAEKNLSRTRDRLNELERETAQRLQQQASALEQEKQDRANDGKNIRDKLEAAQAGGLHISVMGVVWLVAGAIMSTIPGELACIAKPVP